MNDSTIKAKTLTKGKNFFLYFLTLKFKSLLKVKAGKDETLICLFNTFLTFDPLQLRLSCPQTFTHRWNSQRQTATQSTNTFLTAKSLSFLYGAKDA